MSVNIKSIPELVLPANNPLDSDEINQLKTKEAILKTPRKSVLLYLRNSSNSILVGRVLLFNRYPYYFVPLIKYFSDAATFDVAPDTVISIQVRNAGFGLLQADDRISIIGSAVEEVAIPAKQPQTNIYITIPNQSLMSDYSVNNSNSIDNSFLVGN